MRDQEPRNTSRLGLGYADVVYDPAVTSKAEEMQFSWPGGGHNDGVSVKEDGRHCCYDLSVSARCKSIVQKRECQHVLRTYW